MMGGTLVHDLTIQVAAVLIAPRSTFSVWSLACALAVAVVWVASRRPGRGMPLRAFRRILIPRGYLTNRSARLDWALLAINGVMLPLALSGALLSFTAVRAASADALSSVWGPAHPLLLSPLSAMIVSSLVLFLAYELAYFTDHYLKHRVAWLWAFHKVHHSAQSLSPLTNYRIHPVDSLIFTTIVALFTGAGAGAAQWLFGGGAVMTLLGVPVPTLLFIFLLLHLQHSQIWIPATGRLGRWLLSPAHHQLHHSSDPAHFDVNLGNCLALWDRLAGTLLVPGARSPRLRYGVDGLPYDPHTLSAAFLHPFVDAARALSWRKPATAIVQPARAA